MLSFAGLFEVVWAISLKSSQGFTRLGPSALTIGALVVSMYLLAQSAQVLPIGTAYAVWVGIGALGAGVLGVLLFGEPISPLRLIFMGLLLVSIVGLRLS